MQSRNSNLHPVVLFFCFICLMLLAAPVSAEYQITAGPVLSGSSAGGSAVSPNGAYAAVGGESSNEVFIYKTTSDTPIGSYTLPAGIEAEDIELSNDGSVVMGGQISGVFCCYNDGSVKWTQPGIGVSREVSVALTPDGATAYAEDSSTLYRINGVTGAIETSGAIDNRGWGIWELSTNTAGDRVLIRTNSDIIITDADGNEEYFYDIVAGNHLGHADLSPDGTEFVVTYGVDPNHYLSLYSVTSGHEWTIELDGSTHHCQIDENGQVYASTSGGTRIWNNNGTEIIQWGPFHYRFDVSNDGSVFIGTVPYATASQVYFIDDVYTCYPDLYLPAYLLDIDTDSHPTVDYYTFAVSNWQDLPDELFVHSPELPACGLNTEASRTYVRVKGDDEVQYYSFCAVYDKSFFEEFLIAINKATVKPDQFYVELWDRKCDLYLDSAYMQSDHACPIGDINGDCIVNLIDVAMLSENWLVDNN